MADRSAEVERRIAAAPEVVYDLVSDVTRMGDWSPETSSCRWVGGAAGPVVGARFVGSNRRGPLLWSTSCQVTAADRGREFAFSVTFLGAAIAGWGYTFVPDGDGCRVVERWTDRRSAAMRLGSVPVMGIHDRAAHNRRGMEQTLAALARAAESS
jgi:uncharacterized protein YndB with AHSA1/START domain